MFNSEDKIISTHTVEQELKALEQGIAGVNKDWKRVIWSDK